MTHVLRIRALGLGTITQLTRSHTARKGGPELEMELLHLRTLDRLALVKVPTVKEQWQLRGPSIIPIPEEKINAPVKMSCQSQELRVQGR